MYRNLLLFVLSVLAIQHCVAQADNDLAIPDQVSPIRTDRHSIYPTTPLWIKLPSGFHLQRPNPWYQKGDNNLLRMTFEWVRGYAYLKNDHLQRYEYAISVNARPKYLYRKEFKLGNQNAFIEYYNQSMKQNLSFIKMIIGNDKGASVIECEFSAGDKTTRNEIVESLLSIVFDETINPGPGELIDYTFETSNSNLRFAYSLGGSAFLYSFIAPDGKIYNNEENFVNISPFSYAMDTAALRREAMKSIEDIKLMEQPSEISKVSGRHIQKNNLNGYELSFNSSIKDQTFRYFTIIVSNEKNSLSLFAKTSTKELEREVKRVFHTIRNRDQ
jgi:hypothetical protein